MSLIQFRWLHYNKDTKTYDSVRQKNGGGNRFIAYSASTPPSLNDLKIKASMLYFPEGKSVFAGPVDNMVLSICDMTQTAIFEFPNDSLDNFLKEKGLYPSTTYFFLRSQPKEEVDNEFEDNLQEVIDTENNAYELQNTSNFNNQNDLSPAKRITVCVNCSCTYWEGGICLICQQSSEFETSLEVDREIQLHTLLPESQLPATLPEEPVPLSVAEMRHQRVAIFSRQQESIDMRSSVDLTCLESECGTTLSDSTTEQSANETGQHCVSNLSLANPPTISPSVVTCPAENLPTENPPIANLPVANPLVANPPIANPTVVNSSIDNHFVFNPLACTPPGDCPPPAAPLRQLDVHRSCIRKDLINHFKDPSIMESALVFNIINERGHTEKGEGIGVLRDIFTLFWGEFSISMTIGERERVPFVRHFIEEWEAIGRILVKGYMSVKYYPLFLSQAFICYCLFGNQVPDNLLLNSFLKYLAPEEEKLLQPIVDTASLPMDREEFDDFLERFNCRTLVCDENCVKVLLEIAQQELIQKPHLMIASWQTTFQQLKLYPAFQTIAAVEIHYNSLLPTTKKVLDMLDANPTSNAERDALKFLQRFVRGLELSKLVQFLRFTTAMDVIVGNKIRISFIKSEGFSARPIAHTCGPVLELPSTYSNYVELREQFTNILSRNDWEMDIV